jgi:GTPase Era involved in 16S rRNA processing
VKCLIAADVSHVRKGARGCVKWWKEGSVTEAKSCLKNVLISKTDHTSRSTLPATLSENGFQLTTSHGAISWAITSTLHTNSARTSTNAESLHISQQLPYKHCNLHPKKQMISLRRRQTTSQPPIRESFPLRILVELPCATRVQIYAMGLRKLQPQALM